MKPTQSRQVDAPAQVFVHRFSSTPRGARLARYLAVHQLRDWGVPHCSDVSATAALLIAELAANAVTHGHVDSGDFRLRLTLTACTLRIEVSDARGGWCPPDVGQFTAPPPLEAEHGRGLFLVAATADRWTVFDRGRAGKTVGAELDLPH
ncbi:ATP-binding protein [Embleya sp. NPDC056575]|uniref:ATP-binding protein n=1 Tax=unclassified Embleya TaxID=2699296 RepID=UPI00369A4817